MSSIFCSLRRAASVAAVAAVFILTGCSNGEQTAADTAPGAENAAGDASSATPPPVAAASGSVAALVNGTPVLETEVSQMIQVLQQQQFVPPDSLASGTTVEEKQRSFAVERLIERILILEDAAAKGFRPSTADVDAQLPGYKNSLGFAEGLPADVTENDVRQNLSDDLTIKAYIDSTVMTAIDVTDADIDDFYNENEELFRRVRVRHIVFLQDATANDFQRAETLRKAQEVLEKVKNGEDFAELARQHSEGPSAPNGGDLGLFGPGQMDPTFEAASFALSPGETSEIVESQFGLHIIKSEEKTKLALEDIRPQMQGFILDKKTAAAVEGRLKNLKSRATIDRSPQG